MIAIGCLLALVLWFGCSSFFAWLVMLLWNVIASQYGFVPLTFWASFCIVVLLSFVAQMFKPYPKEWTDSLTEYIKKQ